MTRPESTRPLYPNPFYVLLVLASTVFVITVLGYLVAPMIQRKALDVAPGATPPGSGSLALAAWFDRWGVLALTVEMVIMIASGLLAMLVDRWFPSKPPRD